MSKVSATIGKAAPLLSGVLNAFIPGSGLIVSGLMSLFGAKDQEELIDCIKNDPESALKLRTFELQHERELLALLNQDRANARNNEIEVTKATGKKDWIRPFLVVITTLVFASLCYIVAFTKADSSDKDLFYLLIGSLNTVWAGSIIGYYFGGLQKTPSMVVKPPELLELPVPAQTRKG